MKKIIIGSRGSLLALKQAEMVKSQLLVRYPYMQIDISVIKTMGDKILDSPLSKIGGKGIFVKEIEEALFGKKIDLAVHSMKDLPIELPKGLCVGAILKRGEYRDAFVSKRYQRFLDLPRGATVGTSSLRRRIQILKQNPTLHVIDVRGNVDTRLKKMLQHKPDALVMSAVGLERLGLGNYIQEKLKFLPAVGQGALAIEIRKNDHQIKKMISFLNHPRSFLEVELERFFLKKMGGGCQVPIGALAKVQKKSFSMKAFIGSLDGSIILEHKIKGFLEDAHRLVRLLSQEMLNNGGKKILENMSHVEAITHK